MILFTDFIRTNNDMSNIVDNMDDVFNVGLKQIYTLFDVYVALLPVFACI